MTLRARFTRSTLSAETVNAVCDEVAHSDTSLQVRTPGPAGPTGQRRASSSCGRPDDSKADQSWYEKELVASEGFKELLDRSVALGLAHLVGQ